MSAKLKFSAGMLALLVVATAVGAGVVLRGDSLFPPEDSGLANRQTIPADRDDGDCCAEPSDYDRPDPSDDDPDSEYKPNSEADAPQLASAAEAEPVVNAED